MDRVSPCNIYVNQPDTQNAVLPTTAQHLDVSSSTQNTTYQICNIQLENAPEDGPLRSETCRATKCYE